MKTNIGLILAIGLFSFTAHSVNKESVKKAAAEYAKVGAEILPSLKDGSATESSIASKIDVMVAQAQTVMKEYAAKFPQSKKLVEHLIAQTSNLKKASFESLEKDYHDAGKLTKDLVGIDLKDEENEKFLDPCHIMIHPLMVLAAAREKKSKEGLAELNEGMEQMKSSESELLK